MFGLIQVWNTMVQLHLEIQAILQPIQPVYNVNKQTGKNRHGDNTPVNQSINQIIKKKC